MRLSHDKDQQILRLEAELQAKQVEITSLCDQSEQREEILEQKGTQNLVCLFIKTIIIFTTTYHNIIT